MKDKNFTIFLVLKDRPAYTIRFMQCMNFLEYPFNIIIADGGRNEMIQNILKEKNNFPNLNYEYEHYGYDKTLDDFYNKMALSIDKINTPLASVMDNDDFFILDGVAKCINFLKNNKNYSSARGAINSISVSQDVIGYLNVGKNMYSKYMDHIIGESASQRVLNQSAMFHSNWHNVARSNHLKACWNMINLVKPQNMRFTEQITGYLNIVWGHGHRDDFLWLLHQHGQRIELNDKSLQLHFPEQEKWIKSDYWLENFNKMTEVVATAISHHDNINFEMAAESFRKSYVKKLPHLEKLLTSRINEASSIGYNEARIQELFNIIKKYKVLQVDPIEDVAYNFPSSEQEIFLLQKFLLGEIK